MPPVCGDGGNGGNEPCRLVPSPRPATDYDPPVLSHSITHHSTEFVMKRTGSAIWTGGLKDGKGAVSTQTKTLNGTPYSFQSRFESGSGTNPEELLAAAHAGCFSMALAFGLQTAGMTPQSVETTATVELEQVGGGFSITKIHLATLIKAPGKDAAAIKAAAEDAKKNCPVSKALASVPMTLEAKVEV